MLENYATHYVFSKQVLQWVRKDKPWLRWLKIESSTEEGKEGPKLLSGWVLPCFAEACLLVTSFLLNQKKPHACLIHRWEDKASTICGWDFHFLHVCPSVENLEGQLLELIWERERGERDLINSTVGTSQAPVMYALVPLYTKGLWVWFLLHSISLKTVISDHKGSRPSSWIRMIIWGKTALYTKIICSRSSPEGRFHLLPVTVPRSRTLNPALWAPADRGDQLWGTKVAALLLRDQFWESQFDSL